MLGLSVPAASKQSPQPDQGQVGYDFLISLGNCRLFGVAVPPDCEVPLPGEVLIAAGEYFLGMLETFRGYAVALPSTFDDAEPFEDISHCNSVLHQRMAAWAVFVAFDSEYHHHLDAPSGAVRKLRKVMDRVLDSLEEYDAVLQGEEVLSLLTVCSDSPLLENWRKRLDPSFHDPLPWWLDGKLEELSRQMDLNLGRMLSSSPPTRGNGGDTSGVDRDSRATLDEEATTPPRAVALLAARSREIAAQRIAMAASAGNVSTPAELDLLQERFMVEGDTKVRVRLDLVPKSALRTACKIVLIGKGNHKEKYGLVEVGFRDGTTRPTPLNSGFGIVELADLDVSAVAALTLVDSQGNRRAVRLG